MEDKFKGLYRIDSSRFNSWDYSSSGLYFVTICTKNRVKYFGEILETQGVVSLHPSEIGKVAINNWLSIQAFHPYVYLDQFTLMPNHLHGILGINKSDECTWNTNTFGPQSQNLPSIIRGFKSSVTTFALINNIEFEWQSRYHDRIIRSKEEFDNIRQYIFKNPESWLSDPDYRE